MIVSADDKHRYSGVGVFVSARVAPSDHLSFHTWIRGRLLHVRCHTATKTLDIVAGYQHVWQGHGQQSAAEKCSHYWDQLSKPQLQPINGHIGHGTLRTRQQRDPEFEAVVTAQNLVVLNSWCSSASGVSHTFCHGQVRSMIDIVALRRPTADALSRKARAENFDLAPWRQGPKHRAVVALIPWRAGWTFGTRKSVTASYSAQCLRRSIKDGDARSQELRGHIIAAIKDAETVLDITRLNATLVAKCQALYPRTRRSQDKPSTRPEVEQKVEDMWTAHRQLGRGTRGRHVYRLFDAWRRVFTFRKASRELQKACREARTAWFEERICQAEAAARNMI